jgi:hypothetical protein
VFVDAGIGTQCDCSWDMVSAVMEEHAGSRTNLEIATPNYEASPIVQPVVRVLGEDVSAWRLDVLIWATVDEQ